MPIIKNPNIVCKVDIIESELGWGQKIDETIYFDDEEEARKYAEDYNKLNNPPRDSTPEWYMFAKFSKLI